MTRAKLDGDDLEQGGAAAATPPQASSSYQLHGYSLAGAAASGSSTQPPNSTAAAAGPPPIISSTDIDEESDVDVAAEGGDDAYSEMGFSSEEEGALRSIDDATGEEWKSGGGGRGKNLSAHGPTLYPPHNRRHREQRRWF